MTSFVTNSALSYIRFLAQKALKKHKPKIIGIAGSVGKSSTRNAIEAVLSNNFRVKSVGNSETGIPLGILGMSPSDYSKLDWAKMMLRAPFNMNYLENVEYLIVEMGIDEPDPPKNMEYLLSILKPDIAINLNVSATHSEQFDKAVRNTKKEITETERLDLVVQKIAEEDTKIIRESGCKVGIYNADDTYINEALETWSNKKNQTKLLTFGKKNKNDVSYGIYSVNLEGSYFQLFVETDGENQEIKLKFKHFILPEEYREVFAASILTALQAGMKLDQIKQTLEKNFTLPHGRSSFFTGTNNSMIIDSTYNSSKSSMNAFLDLLDKLENETNREIALVMGDMRELGKEAKIEHESVARRIIGTVDYLYLVGPQTMEYVLPIVQQHDAKFKEIRWFETSGRVGEHLREHIPQDSIILFKGSQNTIFLEEAIKPILKDKQDIKNLCRQSEFWMKQKSFQTENHE